MENKREISASTFRAHVVRFDDGTSKAIGLEQDVAGDYMTEYFSDDEAKELRDFLNEVFPNE